MAIFSVIIVFMVVALVAVLLAARWLESPPRKYRPTPRRCQACGYDMRTLGTFRCPECGKLYCGRLISLHEIRTPTVQAIARDLTGKRDSNKDERRDQAVQEQPDLSRGGVLPEGWAERYRETHRRVREARIR
jgi:predicted RNA-binding Zn-ribbon protein involved in translation (DUF1610 family)